MEDVKNKSDMIPIPVHYFFSGLKTDMDVYIQLSEKKFILINKSGEPFDPDRIKKYQKKHITHLYIDREKHQIFLNKQISIAGIAIKTENLGAKKQTNIVSKVSESVYGSIKAFGFNKELFESSKATSGLVIELIESHPTLSTLFEGLEKFSDESIAHSISVSFIAPMIARKLRWTRPETLEKLALGGMLHDIGKKELSPETKGKSRANWSYEEIKEYESHPYRGMMILSSIKIVPEDIISIVYEHHENSMGQGFPRRLWDAKIHPLARVVAVADIFCNLTLPTTLYPKSMSPEQALRHIEFVMGQPYNKEAFNALKQLVEESTDFESKVA